MPRLIFVLTPALCTTITAFIRAGGYPHVAAEAAGIPIRVFEKWLRMGASKGARPFYRQFWLAVRQARAQARLFAETKALNDKPTDWLKSGPGREADGAEGWTAPTRSRTGAAESNNDPLADPSVQKLFHDVQNALRPYPEIQTLVGDKLQATADQEEKLVSDASPKRRDGPDASAKRR